MTPPGRHIDFKQSREGLLERGPIREGVLNKFLENFLIANEIVSDLKIPLLKTINGQKALSYRGAKLWNCLERATKLAPSLKIFKDHL